MEAVSEPQPDAVAVDVDVVEPLGSQNLLTVSVAGHKLKVSTHPTFPAEVNQRLWIRFPSDHIRWIDPKNEKVLYG
jgi:ABC-type sugar transport system ATPase subunit